MIPRPLIFPRLLPLIAAVWLGLAIGPSAFAQSDDSTKTDWQQLVSEARELVAEGSWSLAVDRFSAAVEAAPSEADYLAALRRELPEFLDARGDLGLAVYNAGTDVYAGDPLGGLQLSAAAIAERDAFTVGELRRRGIPTVMVLSGGYTRESYRLVADSVRGLLGEEAARSGAAQAA